ncbi:MAG: GNAT family N-acetyltransferase [Pseudomonadota bacterium]
MNKVSIVNYESEMALELREVYFTAIRMICVRDYTQEQVAAWAPENFDPKIYQEKMDRLKPFVAKIDSKVVGYADLQPDGLIDHFFVHGEYQAQGIAKSLMQTILKAGKNLPKLYSHVSFTAKPFYQKMGFIVERVQDVEIRGVVLQNNVMVFLNKKS